MPEGAFTDTHRNPFTPADIRFTQKGNTLLCLLAGLPAGRGADHRRWIRSTVKSVRMLGSDEAINWRQDDDGLRLSAPATPPCDYVCAYAIELGWVTLIPKPLPHKVGSEALLYVTSLTHPLPSL